jgi:hypothetical protein
MVSSIQNSASWLPASHASQVSSPEGPGEMEHDGDQDDGARSVNAVAVQSYPRHMGNKVNTLA